MTPWTPWDGKDFINLPVLVKVKGKCTTDHISPAGPWLSLRGHLDKFSDNMFMGATNAFDDQIGKTKNIFTNQTEISISNVARYYKSQGVRWIVVGDYNYGEGSSREHAALSPRLLGGAAVIARSFARIHETNLKKQGLLPLTFNSPEEYDLINQTDRISLVDLDSIAEGVPIKCEISHDDGSVTRINLNHSFGSSQIEWFRAGSALNLFHK